MGTRNKLIGASTAAVAALAVAAPGASATELFAGTAGKERLVVFSSKNPGDVDGAKVRGLAAGDRITGLDVRPCTRRVYAQGTAEGTSRLYQLRLRVREGRVQIRGEVRARPLGMRYMTDGRSFGFDFNPTVDRIRVVSEADENKRVSPGEGGTRCPEEETPRAGTVTEDLPLQYALTDENVLENPTVVGSGYTNNRAGATETELYGIDAGLDVLVEQDPPNNGTLNTVGELGVDATRALGFDVARDNRAWAAIRRAGGNRSLLYRVNLDRGKVRKVGRIGGPERIQTLATLGRVR